MLLTNEMKKSSDLMLPFAQSFNNKKGQKKGRNLEAVLDSSCICMIGLE